MSKIVKYVVNIVGVGGTGGNFAKEFCRYVSCIPNEMKKNIEIIFTDGDIVEEKNLERQPFIDIDINQSKAGSLAEAVQDNFGLSINVYDRYLDNMEELKACMNTVSERMYDYGTTIIPIVIGCVDNHRARQVMHDYFDNESTCIYLDSANEYSIGEVVCACKIDGTVISKPRGFYYPEVLTDNSPSKTEESCSAINESSPQHIATNMMAANILLIEVTKLLSEGIMPNGIIYFDSFQNFMKKRVPMVISDSLKEGA